MSGNEARRGGCLCGGVRFEVRGPLRDIVYCHCGQCRKQTGAFYAATSAEDVDLMVRGDEALRWYAASEEARRGFCGTCGSALFWKRNGATRTSILAGAFDDGSHLRASHHIYMADRPAWDEPADGLPRHEQSD